MKHENQIKLLVDAFRPKDWTAGSLKVYCSALVDLDEQTIQHRVIELIRTSDFMPSIAQLRASSTLKVSPDEIISHAKYLLNHPMRRSDDDSLTQLTVKVIEKLGGWKTFGSSPDPQYAHPTQTATFRNQIKAIMDSIPDIRPSAFLALEANNG